jgi:hypothetical protein
VFSVFDSHLWAWDNHHATLERGYEIRFSISFWAGIVAYIFLDLYLLPDRLTAQRHRDVLESVLPMLLEISYMPLAVRQRLWFSTTSSNALWGRYPALAERDLPWMVHWTSRADCMASSIAGSNFFYIYIYLLAIRYLQSLSQCAGLCTMRNK